MTQLFVRYINSFNNENFVVVIIDSKLIIKSYMKFS